MCYSELTSFRKARCYSELTSFRKARYYSEFTSFRKARCYSELTSFRKARCYSELTSFRKARRDSELPPSGMRGPCEGSKRVGAVPPPDTPTAPVTNTIIREGGARHADSACHKHNN